MDEQIPNFKHRRKPFLAAFLSFISFGLGYVYCGRIVRGLVTAFICVILLPHISYGIVDGFSQVNTEMLKTILVLSLISIIISFAVIIDSYLIARKSSPGYELKDYNRWYIYLIFYLLIAICENQSILNIKSNLMEAFRTSSFSMFPTIERRDRFLANKKAYKQDDPKRGDVIVFISPEDRQVDFVKRVVAVAGDTVEMKNNQLFINEEKLERINLGITNYIDFENDPNKKEVETEGELFIEKNGQTEYTIFLEDIHDSNIFSNRLADFPKKKIPKNFCFVLGDNRNLSLDSRDWGPIPLSTIKGRAEYLYWPAKDWSRFGPVK